MSAVLGSNDNIGASPTVRDVDGSANDFIYVATPIKFSGSYSTGGDTLDLTPIAQAAGATGGLANLIGAYIEGIGPASSLSNVGGFYQFTKGSTLANGKVKVFINSAGSINEYGAGAYGTDVTTDVVMLYTQWRKFQ